MRRWLGCLLACVAACGASASAQTRAWLDRAQVTYGETATLNIETTAAVAQVDYRPLAARFDIAGQTVRRSFERVNGQSRTRSLFAVGIRPRGPGVLTVPALQVGAASTTPLRLTVLPPRVRTAGGDADAFVETIVDATRPYVQQSVGMVVRLHVAVPLLSGQLDQDEVADASLQRVGEDIQYQRELGGRRYNVVERRYLLIPERSGALVVPGARFNGQAAGGFLDEIFDDGRKPLSAAAASLRLQVQPIPPQAAQPWLPLHDLRLRYVQAPAQGRVGEATTIEVEAIADGARASQLPPLQLPEGASAQLFAEPAQSDEQFVEGRPRTIVRRRIAVVPVRPGALALPGPRIAWWDVSRGVARMATLPPLRLQVAPGVVDPRPAVPTTGAGSAGTIAVAPPAAIAATKRYAPWLLLSVVAMVAGLAWWRSRPRSISGEALPTRRAAAVATPMPLADALKQDDLAVVARALCAASGSGGDDLDDVRARLDDAAQVEAIRRLQSARWGGGDASDAMAALRRAFARGVRWRRPARQREALLPPLYPE